MSYTIDTETNTIIETCDCGGHTASIGLVGRNAYHDGKPHPATKTSLGTLLADTPVIQYKYCDTENGNYTDMNTEPTNVGFYEASIMVGGQTISVKYQILSASSTVSVDAECIDGQHFGIFSGNNTCSVAKDDAVTVLYSVRNLNENYNVTEPSVVLSQSLPAGTTIIMQVEDSYWYKNIETEMPEIALTEFAKMGENDKFSYIFADTQEYRFVFDFSKVAKADQLNGDLTATLRYKHNSSDNDAASGSVTMTLGNRGVFSMSGTADSLQISAPQKKTFGRWEKKNLVLTVTAKDGKQFPADARLIVKAGDKTYTYNKNISDMFVIPIAWNTSETVSMYLESDLLSAKGVSYTVNVKLCVGDELENRTEQPQAQEYETGAQMDITLSVSNAAMPSLKITGTQKILKATEKLGLSIEMKNVAGCIVHATIQKKEADGYSGNFLDAEVKEGDNQFNLGGIKEAGSYRLLVTVTKENQELLTVPYYFIVQ